MIGQSIARLPEVEPELESKMESDEVWDEGIEAATRSNPFNEPITFESVNVKQYSAVSIRGYIIIHSLTLLFTWSNTSLIIL